MAVNHRLSRTQVLERVALQAKQLDPDDPERLSDAWVTAHEHFHAALLDGCANQRLKSVAATLRASAELYRRWSVPLGGESGRDVSGEHAGILEAAVARDTPRAVDLLTAHIRRTTDILLTSEDATGAAARNQAAAMTPE